MFLGVDAGGSATLAVVADKEGEVIWVGHGGPGNHLCVGIAGVLASLKEALLIFATQILSLRVLACPV